MRPMTSLLAFGVLVGGCRTRPMAHRTPQPVAQTPAAARWIPAPPSESALVADMKARAARLAQAVDALEAARFERAEAEASAVLDDEPDNIRAREAMLTAQLGPRDAQAAASQTARLREWMDDFERAPNRDDQVLIWPSRSFWERICAVRARR